MSDETAHIVALLKKIRTNLRKKQGDVAPSLVKAKVFQAIQKEKQQEMYRKQAWGLWKRAGVFALAVIVVFPFFALTFFATSFKTEAASIGQIYMLSGTATIVRADEEIQISGTASIMEGDDIKISQGGMAEVRFIDHTKTILSEETALTVSHFDRSAVDTQMTKKVLTLHKGEIRGERVLQEKPHSGQETHIETPSGLVRADNDAGFIITLADDGKTGTVIVTDKKADLIAYEEEGKDTQTLALAAGEMASFNRIEETNERAATTEIAKIDPISVEGVTTIREKILAMAEVRPLREKTQAIKKNIVMPVTLSLDIMDSSRMTEMLRSTEIAQVKLISVAEGLQRNLSQKELTEALQSYQTTLDRITLAMTNDAQNSARSVLPKTMRQQEEQTDPQMYISTARLRQILHTLSAKKEEMPPVLGEKVADLEEQLLLLYALESTVARQLQDQDMTYISKEAERIAKDNTLFDVLNRLEQKATADNKRQLRSALAQAAKKKVDTMMTIDDEQKKSAELVEFLNSFTSSAESYRLVEELKTMAEPQYQGYFSVRLHQMKYSEGETGSGSLLR